jgi:hypothetical protein
MFEIKLIDLEEVFIDKARQVFDLYERKTLAKKIFKEVVGIDPIDVDSKKDPSCCNKDYERVYARYIVSYFHSPEDIEWILIGEDNEQNKYYANFFEIKIEEINPKFYKKHQEDWWARKTFDEIYREMPVIEFEKDIEKDGLTWRIIVRIGLYKDSEEE